MESPAILVGVVLGKLAPSKRGAADMTSLKAAAHEAVFGRSIFLLVGALAVGWLCGQPGMAKVEAFFVTPFQGVLLGRVMSHHWLRAHSLHRATDHISFGGMEIAAGRVDP